MRKAFRAAVLCAAGVAALVVPIGAQQDAAPQADPALEQVLARSTWYALDFIRKLSDIVSEERYVQDSNVSLATVAIPALGGRGNAGMSSMRGSSKHRELKADFLIVKAGDQWTPFRDVFEVDHIPIRDRDERLAKLFLSKSKGDASGDERAKEIAEESARYNLGSIQRTINNPVFSLIFLQPEIRSRFRFTTGKPDRKMGDGVRVVDYIEEARPTLIRGLPGQEMPAFGRFWIENETGRIVKAEVRVETKGVKANLTTVFRSDERLGLDVPAELREEYDMPDSRVTGTMSYTRFRRFEVKSSEELAPPAPDPPPQK